MPRKRAKGKKMVGIYLSAPEREALGTVIAKRQTTVADLFREALAEHAKRYGIKIGDQNNMEV